MAMELVRPAVARPLLAGCLLLVAAAVPRARATSASPPPARSAERAPARALDYTVEQVFEDSLAASGGRARLARLVAIRGVGSLRHQDGSVEHWREQRTAPGNADYSDGCYAISIHVDAHGASELEYEHGNWHPVSGGELEDDALDARFDRDLRWRESFREARLLGVADFDGQPAYAVRLVTHGGRVRTRFFSVTSHLEIGYEEQVTIADRHRDDATSVPSPFTFRVGYTDFRTVNGVVLPFRTIRHAAVDYFDELERTWDSYELEFAP